MLALAMLGVAALAAHQGSGPASTHSSAAPRVRVTYPAPGAVVAPGPLTLRVTFDRPMRPGNYSFVQTSAETYPECRANLPGMSADRRTFVLRCKTGASRSYEVWFNRPPYMNFKGGEGTPAKPFQLKFRTGKR